MPNAAKKFDLKVHDFDRRGRLLGKNPYRCHVRDGSKYFERPVGSGNLFFENGEPAGRVITKLSDDGTTISKRFDFKAEHIDYVMPPTGAEKLSAEYEALKAKNAAIEAELAALRAESEARTTQKPPTATSGSVVEKETKTVETASVTQGPAPKVAEAKQPTANYGDML